MCGIVGFTARQPMSVRVLIDGLKALEYRGYDSCGIALRQSDGLMVQKVKGKVAGLEDIVDMSSTGICGIAHTRWATHGEPSVLNAHPHQMERVTLVHNGIIENSEELKHELQDKGYVFVSQTDTEVACAVIDDLSKAYTDKVDILHKAGFILKGSYAFAIMFDDEPESVYAVRRDSPLVLGINDHASYLASDASAFLSQTSMILDLEENEVARLHDGEIEIFDLNCERIKRSPFRSTLSLSDIQKDGYDTFLLKEIHEEPAVIKKTIHHYLQQSLLDLNETMPDLSSYKRFIFIGCGSAMHAGMIGCRLAGRYARILCSAELASEFRYSDPILSQDTLCIFVSQSGETADTLAAMRLCRDRGIDTLAIVNVLGSSLAKEAKYTLYTQAGKEISVATTKAYTSQVCVLALLVLKKAMQENLLSETEQNSIEQQLKTLPSLIKDFMNNTNVERFASHIENADHAFFIGRGIDYALSLEGSLKLKEVSYLHSEAYAAGELKHGTIALIENGTPVVALITDPQLKDKTLSNIKEVQARGACVLLMIREDLYTPSIEADEVILLPALSDVMQAVASVVPYQLMAYHVAKKRGCSIDQPRNLAKSVTVE